MGDMVFGVEQRWKARERERIRNVDCSLARRVYAWAVGVIRLALALRCCPPPAALHTSEMLKSGLALTRQACCNYIADSQIHFGLSLKLSPNPIRQVRFSSLYTRSQYKAILSHNCDSLTTTTGSEAFPHSPRKQPSRPWRGRALR